MITPRILALIAVAILLTATFVGHRALQNDVALRKAIGALLFCSIAGLATSFLRAPVIVWPLAILILGALIFLVWTMHTDRSKRPRTGP
jgi:hydrogenase-4 membrane subunit HyfE